MAPHAGIRNNPAAATVSMGGGACRMLHYSLVFLLVALVAAFLGFSGIAGVAAGIAKLLFFVFLIVFLVSLLLGRGKTVL